MNSFMCLTVVLLLSVPVFAQQASNFKITGEINKEVVFSKQFKARQNCKEVDVRVGRNSRKMYSISLLNDYFLNRATFQLDFFEGDLQILKAQKSVTISSGGITLIALDGTQIKRYAQYGNSNWGANGCEVTVKLENGYISGSISKCSLGRDAEYPIGSPVVNVTGTFNCKDNVSFEDLQ